ncbi:MAG: hypothetical protein QM765_41560 [Myxococcales bacterium]
MRRPDRRPLPVPPKPSPSRPQPSRPAGEQAIGPELWARVQQAIRQLASSLGR